MATILALGSTLYAGGDIAPVEPEITTPEIEVVNDKMGAYAGVAFSHIHNGHAEEGFGVVLGYDIFENLAVEGRFAKTYGDNSQDSTNIVGFLKPNVSIDNFNLYGLVGYGRIDHNGVKGDGIQYGGGFGFDFSEEVGFFADYTWINKKAFDDTIFDGTTLYSVNSGLVYKF